jgi:hypothetical protein
MKIDGYQIFGEVAHDPASPGRSCGFLHNTIDAAKEAATDWAKKGARNIRIYSVERGQYGNNYDCVMDIN